VRITGSDNDQTATRANCITATTIIYRTFTGFLMDLTTGNVVNALTSCTNWIIQKCVVMSSAAAIGINVTGASQSQMTIRDCYFVTGTLGGCYSIAFSHSATVDNAGHVVQNCVALGSNRCISITRVGGITVKNCTFQSIYATGAIRVDTALTVGQTITVNNCIFHDCGTALNATVAGEIVEDYNTLYGNNTDRTNTNTGANSVAYPPLLDPRWFMQLVHAGAGPNSPLQLASPFDLASFSQLVNLAGTSPPATDLRGTAVQGAQREWGALEYDSTLKLFGGISKSRLHVGH